MTKKDALLFESVLTALKEARTQLEYLQGRFQTGTTPPVIMRVDEVLRKAEAAVIVDNVKRKHY